MPAAAVIPAPIAYIKVVAVKKLVVGSRVQAGGPPRWRSLPVLTQPLGCKPLVLLTELLRVAEDFYFEKIRVFKAGESGLHNGAWNNGIGPRFYFVGFRNTR